MYLKFCVCIVTEPYKPTLIKHGGVMCGGHISLLSMMNVIDRFKVGQ